MKIEELTTSKLRRVLRSTERSIGPDAVEVLLLRKELQRRTAKQKEIADAILSQCPDVIA